MSDTKTVYFHIGTHKTGSTALQKFFVENQGVLLKKGVSYANYNEVELNQGFLVNPERWKEVRLPPKLSHIISGEDFYKKILNIVGVVNNRLAGFDIQFIVYFKRQDLMKQSVYNQIVKMHGFYKDISEDNHYDLDYYGFLKRLESAFPQARINVRVYEEGQFEGGSIYADFLTLLGLELTDDFQVPHGVVNPSLSRDKLEFSRLVNMANIEPSLRSPICKAIINIASNEQEVSIFRKQNIISPDEAKSILSKHQKGNEAIAKEFLNREDGVLFKEHIEPDNDWAPYPGMSAEICYNMSRKLVESEPVLAEELWKRLLKQIQNQEGRSKEQFLLIRSLGRALNSSISGRFDNIVIEPFLKLKESINNLTDPADIYREVAIAYETAGDKRMALKIMSIALLLRPSGPVILDKIWQYSEELSTEGVRS